MSADDLARHEQTISLTELACESQTQPAQFTHSAPFGQLYEVRHRVDDSHIRRQPCMTGSE